MGACTVSTRLSWNYTSQNSLHYTGPDHKRNLCKTWKRTSNNSSRCYSWKMGTGSRCHCSCFHPGPWYARWTHQWVGTVRPPAPCPGAGFPTRAALRSVCWLLQVTHRLRKTDASFGLFAPGFSCVFVGSHSSFLSPTLCPTFLFILHWLMQIYHWTHRQQPFCLFLHYFLCFVLPVCDFFLISDSLPPDITSPASPTGAEGLLTIINPS